MALDKLIIEIISKLRVIKQKGTPLCLKDRVTPQLINKSNNYMSYTRNSNNKKLTKKQPFLSIKLSNKCALFDPWTVPQPANTSNAFARMEAFNIRVWHTG